MGQASDPLDTDDSQTGSCIILKTKSSDNRLVFDPAGCFDRCADVLRHCEAVIADGVLAKSLWDRVPLLALQAIALICVRAGTLYAQGHSTPCIFGPSIRIRHQMGRESSDTTLLGDSNRQVSLA